MIIAGVDSDALSDTGLFTLHNGSFSMLFDYDENGKQNNSKNLKPPLVYGSNGGQLNL
jgi:hypothetical protein